MEGGWPQPPQVAERVVLSSRLAGTLALQAEALGEPQPKSGNDPNSRPSTVFDGVLSHWSRIVA
jgi:hypothetical protein